MDKRVEPKLLAAVPAPEGSPDKKGKDKSEKSSKKESKKEVPFSEDIAEEVKPKHKRGELLIFIVFTLLYTLAVLFGRPTEETYYLRQNIISQLVSVQWKNIVEADQFYDYIRTDFVEKITPDPSEYASMSIESRRTIMGYNLIVGAIQVRQVRIDSEACDAIPPGMETVLSRCYGSYSASGQSQNSFGPPGEEGKYTFSERGGALRPLTRGELGSYPASGYIEPLSLNRTRTIELVDQLQADGWISDKTRAIFIEFSLYNPNVNQFLTVRLLGEIPQSGGIITSFAVNSIRVFRYLSTISIGIAVVELLFVAMLIYFMVSEIIAFARLRKQYFKSRWNILDWINLLLLWVTVIIRIVVLVTSMEITIDLTSEETLDLERISSLMDFEAQIASLNIFFIYFRLFEYIADVPRMDQLFRTLARAGIDLALFFIVFTIVFLAFALSFYTSFSLYLAEFRTIPQTIFTLFRVLLGDFDFENMYKANKILGPLLFFLYVVVMFFMLFNMFLAIIADAYAFVKEKDGERHFTVKEAFKHIAYKFWPRKKAAPVVDVEGQNGDEDAIQGDFGPRNKPKDMRMSGSILSGNRRLTIGVATAQAWDDKLGELDRRLFEMNAKMKFLAATETAGRGGGGGDVGLSGNLDLLRRIQSLEDAVKASSQSVAVQQMGERMDGMERKLDAILVSLSGRAGTPRSAGPGRGTVLNGTAAHN